MMPKSEYSLLNGFGWLREYDQVLLQFLLEFVVSWNIFRVFNCQVYLSKGSVGLSPDTTKREERKK